MTYDYDVPETETNLRPTPLLESTLEYGNSKFVGLGLD
jgi:hypothetical protein